MIITENKLRKAVRKKIQEILSEETVKSRSGREFRLEKVNVKVGKHGNTTGFIAISEKLDKPVKHSNGIWVFPTKIAAREWISNKWR